MWRGWVMAAGLCLACAGEAEVDHTECPTRPRPGESCESGLVCFHLEGTRCVCDASRTFLCHAIRTPARDGGSRDGGGDASFDAGADGGRLRSACPTLRPQPGVVEACVGDFTCVYPRDCVTLDPINSLGCACSLGEFVCAGVDDPCPRDAGPRDGGSGDGGADGGERDAG
ncbi:MAG: hypothetical protein RIT81_04895 [Deltaproteobacteria bacterium]